MNKKGIVIFEIGMWVLRIIMVIVIIMGVALQIRTYIDARVNLDVAEPVLLTQILGTSPAFLGGQRVVDIEHFKQADMSSMLYFKQRHAAAKLTLHEQDGKQIAETFVNPKYYNELAPQLPILLGKTVVKQERQWPVRLIEKSKERQGLLRVEVLRKR